MASRQPDTVLYEDFQPKSEEKEDKGAHLFLVYLPDFLKDQIRVTYVQSTRSLIVQGERSLRNNKWSRFNRTFSVSQNCIVEKIHAVFQEGILTITVPKQTISLPQPTASFLNGEGYWFVEKGPMNISPRDSIEQLNPTGHQRTYPPSQTPEKPITEPKAQRGQGQTDTSAKETPKQSIQSDDGKTKGGEKRVDASTPSKAPYEPMLQKEDETAPVQESEKKGDEVKEEISFIERAREMKNVAAAAIKTALEKEDRQSIVNVGVAVLMIMAVGVYVTYNTLSSTNAID